MHDDGKIAVQLDKALYGCLQSGELWYDLLSDYLRSISFKVNDADLCVFKRIGCSGKQIIIGLYVDDLLTTGDYADIKMLKASIKIRFGNIKSQDGPIISFLGMTMNFEQHGVVLITMEKYIQNIFEEFPVEGVAATPGTINLFTINPKSELLGKKLFMPVLQKCYT
jgi:hypothetical protein